MDGFLFVTLCLVLGFIDVTFRSVGSNQLNNFSFNCKIDLELHKIKLKESMMLLWTLHRAVDDILKKLNRWKLHSMIEILFNNKILCF